MPDFLKKGILAVVLVLVYFLGIREVRQVVHDFYMGTVMPSKYGQINENYVFYSQSSVSFTIVDSAESSSKGWQFRIPFDSYWLFGTFALILAGASLRQFVFLVYMHIAAGLITLVFVWIGIKGFDVLLIATDFICRYLIPLISLGYAAFVIGNKKWKEGPDE
jgi:hypothetical protein